MKNFLRKIVEHAGDTDSHRYFVRFGKGTYARRFLMKSEVGKKVKIRTSFELANDLVAFVRELKSARFSGKVLSKEKIAGYDGRKKAGVFVYEVEEIDVSSFGNAYYHLLDMSDPEITLKIKKSLPKPGKNEEKIDDAFCSLDLDPKYWNAAREVFFWDVPEGKKIVIEHELIINDIELPAGENNPVKIRELAKRKGVLVRKITVDGKEFEKKYEIEA